jgi:glutamate--cysteine ligase catalytic subunit
MTEASDDEPYPGFIYMDAMHFGMGQCCLQITYECQTINHARYLHDMLLPFTGIMAALSAAGPIQKGKLSDYDLRWSVIEQSVDCRTKEERDPLSEKFIPKSRYSSMNHYISNHQYVKDGHNDATPLKYDPEHKKILMEASDIDERLADHISRLFVRDPVPSYEGEFIEEQIDDNDIVSHFENV